MAEKAVWIVVHTTQLDPEGTPVVFSDRTKAFSMAADIIRSMASDELESFEFLPEDPMKADLDEILRLVAEGKDEDAVVEWEEYRQEFNAREGISVIEARFIE